MNGLPSENAVVTISGRIGQTVRLVTLLAVVAPLAGCFKTPAPTLREEQRGLVWICPGIGGGAWYLEGVYHAFRDAGVDAAIRIQEWDTPCYNALGHLTQYGANRAQAATAAEQIAAYRQQHPHAPIDLVGYSAGGGMAVLIVEALPCDIGLRNVVLVQAAISPTHDLSDALERIDGHLVNLYSRLDWFVLGLGTAVLGTVDREYVASAGKVGFDAEMAVPDERQRAKLRQQPWTPVMIWSGHLGNHASILMYWWNKAYVAPCLFDPDGEGGTPAAARTPTAE
jgi:pimeloyl-ACP methyl ester carboxylesterase